MTNIIEFPSADKRLELARQQLELAERSLEAAQAHAGTDRRAILLAAGKVNAARALVRQLKVAISQVAE